MHMNFHSPQFSSTEHGLVLMQERIYAGPSVRATFFPLRVPFQGAACILARQFHSGF